MTLRKVPRDTSCRLIKLDYENMCDACKTLQEVEDEQRKSQSKNKFVQPWFANTVPLFRSNTIFKQTLVPDNLEKHYNKMMRRIKVHKGDGKRFTSKLQ